MVTNARTAAALALVLAAAGCRTTEEVLRDYEANLVAGGYAAAVPEVSELAGKEDDTQQLWRLLAGAANYMADDKANALKQFDAAEEVFRKNDQRGVFSSMGTQTLAMMTNDRTIPYDGGGLDRIFTCIYRAIDFMCGGDKDLARVELNRAAQYQANWLYDRRRDIDAAQKELDSAAAEYQKKEGQANATSQADRRKTTGSVIADSGFAAQIKEHCGFDPSSSGDLDTLPKAAYMNQYMLHLAGVFRWLDGDSPLNLLRDAAAYSPGNPVARRDNAEMSAGRSPRNQVWIWVEDGLCPCRDEWRLDLPLFLIPYAGEYVMYAGMAFPVLRERGYAAASWSVSAGGGTSQFAELASIDRLVRTEYDVYMRGALTREITRTLVKIGVQVALGAAAAAAERRNGSNSGDYLALKLSQIGVATWAATTTAADLRSWTALPKTVKVARVDRPADGRISVFAGGQPVAETVVPEGNALIFVRKPSPVAPAVVKVATFP